MKVYPIHLTLLLGIVLCLSCCKHTPFPAELRNAEALMENHPDSALTVLEQISNPKHFDKAAQATYCLLLTQARDKNYIEHTSDSIIKEAVDYFDSHKDIERKAQSYYYLGRVYSDLYQTELAAESYLKALEFAKQADLFLWKGLSANQLGKIYYSSNQYDKALFFYKEACNSSKKINDMLGYVYVLRNIAWVYEGISNRDSTFFYYNLSLEQAYKSALNIHICRSIYADLANYYRHNQEYELAMENIRRALEDTQSQDALYRYYFVIGDLFYKLNQLDSADVYLHKALHSDNLYTKGQTYRLLSDLFAQEANFQRSHIYLNEYIECRDSIESIYQPEEIRKIEANFNYQKAKLLQERNMLKNKVLTVSFAAIALICVICMVLCYSFYQRHLLQKEREINSLKKFVEEKEKVYKENQAVIHKNNLLIIELKRTIDHLESKEGEEAQSSINDLRNRIDNLEKENTLLNRKISTLTIDLLKEKKVLEYIESLPEGEVFSNVVWLKLQTKLKEIEPNFFKNLKRVAPELTLKEKQFCCFLRLSLTNQQIATHLNIDARSVSRYKSKLVKERFGRSDKILLDDLLRLL